jgi:hypothetical protein
MQYSNELWKNHVLPEASNRVWTLISIVVVKSLFCCFLPFFSRNFCHV